LTQFEYKTADLDGWMPAEGHDQQFYTNVGFFDEEGAVDVRGKTADGRTVGPFTSPSMRSLPCGTKIFATYARCPRPGFSSTIATSIFSSLVAIVVSEKSTTASTARNSTSVLPLPPCSLRRHGYMPADDSEVVRLETAPTYIAVQLVYYDGTVRQSVFFAKACNDSVLSPEGFSCNYVVLQQQDTISMLLFRGSFSAFSEG